MSKPDEGWQRPEETKETEEVSYRMVKRKYFCYLCQKEYYHMVSAKETLNCQYCQQGFIELIEKKPPPSLDEEKQRVN